MLNPALISACHVPLEVLSHLFGAMLRGVFHGKGGSYVSYSAMEVGAGRTAALPLDPWGLVVEALVYISKTLRL